MSRHRGPPWKHAPGPGRHGGRPPLTWVLARGIHRTIFSFLFLAVGLGAGIGATLHAGLPSGHTGLLCVGLAACAAIWPLAWMATARVAWPLQRLAAVAGDMRGGQLGRREELPTAPGEVGEVADALRGMADRVARQLRDQRSLMAAVSHELRSPLGRARVLVEMVREGSAPESAFDDLQAEIDAMDGLVGDLLAAARIDFEAIQLHDLDAGDLARRALELARMPVERLSVVEPAVVRADPTLLARALSLVLDNARRYGGDAVRIAVRPRQGWVRFVVEDDGPGFPGGDAEAAFQPFWRGPGGAAGEGLGLSLVRQIAEAHEGEAGAENRPEGGARVWVELPRRGGS